MCAGIPRQRRGRQGRSYMIFLLSLIRFFPMGISWICKILLDSRLPYKQFTYIWQKKYQRQKALLFIPFRFSRPSRNKNKNYVSCQQTVSVVVVCVVLCGREPCTCVCDISSFNKRTGFSVFLGVSTSTEFYEIWDPRWEHKSLFNKDVRIQDSTLLGLAIPLGLPLCTSHRESS